MAPTDTTVRPSKKASRRARGARKGPPARRRFSLPVLPVAVGATFVVVLVALLVAYKLASSPSGQASGQPVANIQCQTNEQVAVHYHAHLTLLYQGTQASVPLGIGIPGGQQDPNAQVPYISSGTCFYWLHTHDDSGIIHIEAPQGSASRVFTLGDLFQIWGQPISRKQIATFRIASGSDLKMWVDGKPYTGDPSRIPLHAHGQVVIEIGAPFQDPPPAFTFPQGL